jgi:hypothetical protein
VNLADPAQVERLVQKFFLTDLVNCETYRQIQGAIQARYQPDENEEWPSAYWDDLTAAIDRQLAGARAQPAGTAGRLRRS